VPLAGAFALAAVFFAATDAANVTIAAGETYTLSADLVLSGADMLTINGTVNPLLASPPISFPFSDSSIDSGATTVAAILQYYRIAYTPQIGSPVIDAGDPADGPGVDIGAVGAGMTDPNDLFGRIDRPVGVVPAIHTPRYAIPGAGRVSDLYSMNGRKVAPTASGGRSCGAWIGISRDAAGRITSVRRLTVR